MVREIKFRAWVPSEKRMAVGHAVSNGIIEIGELWGTLMQFTGLHDKNGEEIWEGDVVLFNSKQKYEVIWHRHGFEFKSMKGWIVDFTDNCEVLGNIYENPELLIPMEWNK